MECGRNGVVVMADNQLGFRRTGGRSSHEISSHGSLGSGQDRGRGSLGASGSDGTDGLRSGTDWCRTAIPDVAYPSAILDQSQYRGCQRQRVPAIARRGKSHCSRVGCRYVPCMHMQSQALLPAKPDVRRTLTSPPAGTGVAQAPSAFPEIISQLERTLARNDTARYVRAIR